MSVADVVNPIPDLVCITGGIGSGKSVVARLLRLENYPVFDCDWEATVLMETDPEVKREVRNLLGHDAYNADGSRNRQYISSRIFADEEMRKSLNAIVHAAVRKRMMEWLLSASRPAFVESAIPVVSGLAWLCEQVWIVDAPLDLRIARTIARSNLTEEEVRRRIQSQACEWTELERHWHIETIKNYREHSLLLQIEKLLNKTK